MVSHIHHETTRTFANAVRSKGNGGVREMELKGTMRVTARPDQHDSMRRIRQPAPARHANQQRQRLAHEAARLMADTGLADYAQAKRKAAQRLGVLEDAALPGNDEIHAALREYQRLFQHTRQPAALRQRREAALQALEFFAGFAPRLTGPVLDGSADAHSPVLLHLHSDDAEAVARHLLDSGIPASVHTASVRLNRERTVAVPAWHFSAEGVAFEVKVLPWLALRQAPLSALDDKPAARASATQLRELLKNNSGAS